MKRFISILLSITILCTLLSMLVSADEIPEAVAESRSFHAPPIRNMIEVNLELGNVDEEFYHLLTNEYADNATPAVDWENYDWAHLDATKMDIPTWESALVWLETKADLSLLLFVRGQTDGMASTDIAGVLPKRFQKAPTEFLYELTKEDNTVWQDCVFCVIYGANDWDAMVESLETVELSGPNAEKGYEILTYMIDYAKQEYRKEIHNPHTGDSAGVFVALLVVSGLFGGVLLTQRKRLTA